MFTVGAFQRLVQKRPGLEGAVRRRVTFVDVSLFGGHQYSAGFGRDDRSHRLASRFPDDVKASPLQTRRARFSANPKRAGVVAPQGQHSSRRQAVDGHGLRAAPIEFRQTRFRSKPHRAVRPLRDRVHAIRRQPVKERDRAPLMQAGYRRRRRRRGRRGRRRWRRAWLRLGRLRGGRRGRQEQEQAEGSKQQAEGGKRNASWSYASPFHELRLR